VKADWKKSTLGNVLSTLKNGLNCKQNKDGAGQKISRIESIATAYFDINRVGFSEISESDKAKFKLLKGDILFSHINSPIHVGKTATFNEDEDVYHGVNLLLMRPNEEVLPAYLELYLKYLFESGYWLKRCKQSVNQASVNQQDIAQVAIEFPSNVTEQHRIVTLLDEAFADIATAKANAEKNLQNARALFISHLQSGYQQQGEGWSTSRITDIAKHSLGKMLDKAKNRGDLKPYLRNLNVRWFDFDLSDVQEMKFTPEESDKYTAIKGDVLICEGGYPGRCAIWEDDEPIYFQKALHRVRFHNPLHNKWFVNYLYLMDQTGDLKSHFSGTGIQHFTGEALAKFTLPTPSDRQIHQLLDKSNQLETEVVRLESIYRQKLTALDDLKKSLLHQAFSGQL
jgi:type I restriction enzyme, S subunit